MNRDLIVIGGSAGGIEVLLGLVPELPRDLPAAILVAIHTQPGFASQLPELLSARGALHAIHPIHNEEIQRGHIYVAPPDNQLLVRPGFMDVVRGPRENGHRPAIDALFRTASWAYGARVIGVLLSGYQDCGTAGLMSIKARGGVAVVQSPETAEASEMPRSAIQRVAVDHVVNPKDLPGLLSRLVGQPVPEPEEAPSKTIQQLEGKVPGAPFPIVCPVCHGALTETVVGDYRRFRCHVGHGFSAASLAQEQSEELERALWAATRSLEEGSTLSQRLAASSGDDTMARRFAEKATTLSRQADLIREILLHGEVPSLPKLSAG